MHRPFQAILRFRGLGRHAPPDEVGAPEHCIWKPFTSGKLPNLDCLGIRARRVGAFCHQRGVANGSPPGNPHAECGCFCPREHGCLESPGGWVSGNLGVWKPDLARISRHPTDGCPETLFWRISSRPNDGCLETPNDGCLETPNDGCLETPPSLASRVPMVCPASLARSRGSRDHTAAQFAFPDDAATDQGEQRGKSHPRLNLTGRCVKTLLNRRHRSVNRRADFWITIAGTANRKAR
jgi:hypothetical protein